MPGLGKSNRLEHRIERDLTVPTTAMLQQVLDRHIRQPSVRDRIQPQLQRALEHVQHPVAELQAAPLDQLQHGHRRDGLGDAGNAKEAGGLNRHGEFHVRIAIPAGQHQAALVGDGQRQTRHLVLLHQPDDRSIKAGQLPVETTGFYAPRGSPRPAARSAHGQVRSGIRATSPDRQSGHDRRASVPNSHDFGYDLSGSPTRRVQPRTGADHEVAGRHARWR